MTNDQGNLSCAFCRSCYQLEESFNTPLLHCTLLCNIAFTLLDNTTILHYCYSTTVQFLSYCTAQCCTMLYCTTFFCTALQNCSLCTTLNVLYYAMLYTAFAEPYCIVLHSTILCTVLYHTLCCDTHYFVLKCNLMFRTEAQCTAHCTFLYYAPLYYNILYCCAH